MVTPRSSATGSSSSPARPRPSTASWRPRTAPWPAEGLHHQPDRPVRPFVVDAYHQLWRIEKSFRMSKHDLQARPIYHHIRESIEAHLSIVVAAMAVSHWIEVQTGGASRNLCAPPAATAPSASRPADKP